MSENPLLPHRKLRELHALMLRCRALERKQKSRGSRSGRGSRSRPLAREALLAATSIHLLPGDLLGAAADDEVARQLSPTAKEPGTSGSLIAASSLSARLPLCAAAARGLQAGGTDGIVLAFAQAGVTEPHWKAALEWAHQLELPLLIACADATGSIGSGSAQHGASALRFGPLNWGTMSRFAKRLRLPLLTVDGEDTVAVYRVMQESALRARLGGGPAVLWAMMTPLAGGAQRMQRSSRPIARLEAYMAARGIALHS